MSYSGGHLLMSNLVKHTIFANFKLITLTSTKYAFFLILSGVTPLVEKVFMIVELVWVCTELKTVTGNRN